MSHGAPDWNRDALALDVHRAKITYLDGNPHYMNRRVIMRDTPIDKGVYLSVSGKNPIVVDMSREPLLVNLYSDALQRATRGWMRKRVDPSLFPQAAYDAVNEWFVHRADEDVDAVVGDAAPGGKVGISEYLLKRTADCRAIALANAALLERAIVERVLTGRVSVDRNYVPSLGAHIWSRHMPPGAKAKVYDAALHFIGSVDDSLAPHPYRRPSE